MPPARIVFVMPFHMRENRGGGAEVQSWMLAKALAKRSHEVHYVYQTCDVAKVGCSESADGVTLHRVPPPRRLGWSDHRKYRRQLERIQPDVIVQRLASDVTFLLARYARRSHARFVWMCPDSVSGSPWKDRNATGKALRAVPKPFYKAWPLLANAVITDLLRQRGMQGIDLAIAQNRVQQDQLRNSFNLAACLLPSGHETPRELPTESERFSRKRFVWAGNLGPNKRPQLFQELAQRMSDTDASFIMMGHPKSETQAEELRENRSGNLHYLGRLSQDACLAEFDRASVVVNTSIKEGFPNTFIQGWLRGLPSLSLGVDPDGVIQRNNIGLVAKNIDELESQARALIEDRSLYLATAQAAHRYAMRNHDIDSVAERFLELLKQNHILDCLKSQRD